ncbi:MAG: 5,10-methylenetetrahydromethanopterin reductase [Haloarculaceae archaeon]
MLGIELTPEHPVSHVADLGVLAEDAGFDTVFVTSHYFNRDPFVSLDRVARRTERVRVGPAAANPYEIHPVTLASRVASLQEASGGRAVYGIGPGDPSTLGALGLAEERGLRSVLEAFEAARDLWAGESVTHDGTFRASDAGLKYDVAGAVPVYVAGEGPSMCRMAAKRADGLLFNGSHPDDLAWARERVAEGLAERPDGSEELGKGFDLAAYAAVSVAEDADAAHEAARPPVAFITAGAAPPVLERHGIDRGAAERVSDALSAGRFSDAFGEVTPTMVEAFSIAGTPEAVANRAKAVLDYADSLVLGTPLGPDVEAAIDLLGGATRGLVADPRARDPTGSE